MGRWNCHDCKRIFNVLSGTIMKGTHIPLRKRTVAISLAVNAKKMQSRDQLSRDLDLNQKSAWYMRQRIRAAMVSDQTPMLKGGVEADETYVGCRPLQKNKRDGGRRGGQGKSERHPKSARSNAMATRSPRLPKVHLE